MDAILTGAQMDPANLVQVFCWDGEPGTAPGTDPDEYLVWDVDANAPMPGWFWRLPQGDPIGPFDTEAEATANARGDA